MTNPSSRERAAGITLFLVVTACWMLGLASAEQDWVRYADLVLLIAIGVSAVSLVATGYLGRVRDALWLGWIPGAAMTAIGFAMTPEPGGDERGGRMVFFGGLVLAFGWPLYTSSRSLQSVPGYVAGARDGPLRLLPSPAGLRGHGPQPSVRRRCGLAAAR
jgi:hypothetical protein